MKMDKFSTPLAYSTSGSLLVYGINVNDWALAIGVLGTVVTVAVNWYYKALERRDRLQALGRAD